MKNKYHLLILSIICSSFLLVMCGKDGAVGPQGAAGDKGSTGATGAIGPAGPAGVNGKDGSIIYSGNTVPANTQGIIGDFYLNTATGLLYGPKTSTGWGTGVSLKGTNGATGATGAAGSTTLSGGGLPATSLGKNGDYYLDKTNYLLYGPKTGSGWGLPVNLRGPAGPQGPEGNANVKVDTFTVKTTEWATGTYYWLNDGVGGAIGTRSRYFDRNNTLITADLLNSGLVLVYFQSAKIYNTVQWQPLPLAFTNGFNGFAYNYAYETFIGKVRLHFYLSKVFGAQPDIDTFVMPTQKFKIIVVSGTLINAIHTNHINLKNYHDVSKFLGIN